MTAAGNKNHTTDSKNSRFSTGNKKGEQGVCVRERKRERKRESLSIVSTPRALLLICVEGANYHDFPEIAAA